MDRTYNGMEVNEEIVVMSNENEIDNSAVGDLPGDDAPVDYSNLSKKEFVDLLKEFLHQSDFKKADSELREIKKVFDRMREGERTAALQRFVASGGTTDDFEYRPDALDVAFDANYKLLRDRKIEFIRQQENQKHENLLKKQHLLEELRKLVDGEDDRHSFDKFKDIQQAWKTIGNVPPAEIKPLWASYHALVDRFYDNRNIYFELKELDRKRNLEAKLELCVRAEKLASVEKIGEAVRELNELHEEYKHVGPVAREEKDAVWERFKAASDAVYERRDAFQTALQQEWNKNLELKEAIIADATALSSFQSDRIKEWNEKGTEILNLQKKWESIGAVPRSKAKEINKRFWSAFKAFFGNKSAFFKKLDEERSKNLEMKRTLISEAEALKDSHDWDKAANALKDLQVRWKSIGPVPEKLREKVYQEFKSACDHFFNQRRQKFEEADKIQADNLEKKEAIIALLEKTISEKSGSLGQLKELQRSFHDIGFVPRQAMSSVKSRFNSTVDKYMASLEASQEDKDKMMLEIQLENLKTDPDAGHKIHLKEQSLKKRISKAENDVAVLRNNLEFFARSKNADKLRAEFNEKIDAANAEVVQLKSQLKLLKQAQ